EISAWFGKSKDVSLKELNYLASQKVGEGYELLGVMQKGFLVDSDIERLSSQPMQHISLKKETAKEGNQISPVNAPGISKAGSLNSANRETISFSLANAVKTSRISVFNAKGVIVWQRNLGELPAGSSSVDWDGASLPLGSYHVRLEANGAVLAQKFELK
ncbi:MAG: hypothetical protein LBH25_04915, partial [Fibromonadaceae bacterium]|nr:hypothetical protein [Fibromonadaceae bacterium]